MKIDKKLKQALDRTKTNARQLVPAGLRPAKGKTRKSAATTKKSSKKPVKRNRVGGSVAVPKVWWRRWLWYAHPKRFRDWWFTKPGMLAAARIAGVFAGLVVIAIAGLFLYFARDLPSPGQINARALEQTTRFYDRSGEHLLYEVFGDKNRVFVPLEDMGEHVANATIAIEDRNFYDQGAFSSLGILRAAIYNVFNLERAGLQGGSTITQQYVKNALLDPEQTLTRKIKELILSMQIEQLYDKDDILELYLNEIGYGAQAYGVQAASQMYFSKDADELDLDEAAMLAALPQAPTFYSPYGQNAEALKARINTVLRLMAEQGYITDEEAEEAIESDTLAKVNDTPDAYRDIRAPHFVLSVQEELERRYGVQEVSQGGLEVITTIDLDKQDAAEKAVADNIATVDSGGGNNAALVASDPNTGQVLAMVGSRDFEQPGYGAYNAAQANRQPGSSFKPYIYAEAFENSTSWGAGSIMYDVRTDFGGGYTPRNFEGGFRGAMTVRSALAQSRNIPAVKMLYIVGMENALNRVDAMGIKTLSDPSNYGLSLVLGAGEVRLDQHVNAYESFANGGLHYQQTKILKVTNPDGVVLEEWEEPEPERVLDEQVAYLISDILSDDGARAPVFGSNSPLFNVPGHTLAIKTGTTDNQRDGWMMGYSRSLAAGVWVGHNDNQEMHLPTDRMSGPIFTQFMAAALDGVENQSFDRPDGVKTVQLDRYTGDRPTENSRSTVNDLFPSWYEASDPEGVRTATIDKVSGNLATECTPNRAKEEVSSFGMSAEISRDDPAFHRWNPPVQALARSMGLDEGSAIPTEESTVHSCDDAKPKISVEAEADDGDIDITIEVTEGTHRVDEVILRYNGQQIRKFNRRSNQTYRHTFSPGSCPEDSCDYRFEAEVVDEALYHDTATSNTVTIQSQDEEASNGNGLPFGRQRNGIGAGFISLLVWRWL